MTGVVTSVAGRGVSIVRDPSDAIASNQPVRWAIGELKRSFAASGIPVPEIYTNVPAVDAAKNHLYHDTLPPKVFDNVSSFDPEMFSHINDCAAAMLKGNRSGRRSPLEVAQWIEDFASEATRSLAEARARGQPAFARVPAHGRGSFHPGRARAFFRMEEGVLENDSL